jgi:ABC-type uncharacterized transport system fused permease/ATPase subunit
LLYQFANIYSTVELVLQVIEVPNDLYNKSSVHVSAKIVSCVIFLCFFFFVLHNLTFEAVSVNIRSAALALALIYINWFLWSGEWQVESNLSHSDS